MKHTRRRILAAGITAAAAAAAGAAGARFILGRPRRNVILIVADAFRGDRVGHVSGYTRLIDGRPRTLTPRLDALAKDGAALDMAIAPSSWTPISMGSIFYGVSPLEVTYGQDIAGRSLAETLAAGGYRTAAVVANEVLDVPEMRKGFSRFVVLEAEATQDLQHAKRRLASSSPSVNGKVKSLTPQLKAGGRFFLYVHYMDTHEPYYAAPWALSRLGARFNQEVFTTRLRAAQEHGRQALKSPYSYGADVPFDEAVRILTDHYDAAVMSTDKAVEELLRSLDEEGLLEDTLVVFTADHGEEFGDNVETRPAFGHNQNLSQPQIHVPLVCWSKGRRLECASPSAPTSSAASINAAVRWFAEGGEGAIPAASGQAVSYLNYEGFHGVSDVSGNVKCTLNLSDPAAEPKVYHLRAGTVVPVTDASFVSQAKERMAEIVSRGVQKPFDSARLTEEQRRKLQALGYLQ